MASKYQNRQVALIVWVTFPLMLRLLLTGKQVPACLAVQTSNTSDVRESSEERRFERGKRFRPTKVHE
jgi:hypothetical protein